MLSYAFKELKQNNYQYIAGEDFEDIHDLFAEILCKGIAYILKQGLYREYVGYSEALQTLRGKLNLQDTIKEKLAQRSRLACDYDELSENNLFNQIIKAASKLLIYHSDVNVKRKQSLKKLMIFFENVDDIHTSTIKWNRLRYDRNSRSYEMIHSLCYFLIHNQLLSTDDGSIKIAQFSDKDMNLLFQRFVMEYYKKHHKDYQADAKQIKWNLQAEDSYSMSMLPNMQTDITLQIGDRKLIIDTKYYGKTLQQNYGKNTFHSPNMYQIHTYVMNEDASHTGKVDGMLLYAHTSSILQPNNQYTNSDGNIFMVRTLNLNADFDDIKAQLDSLPNYL
jgi:5-methylcytosine-specific restriction enzyme subunit McrC